jgi:AcrR family transcriptional regulator
MTSRAPAASGTRTPDRLLDAALAVFERDRFAGYTVHAVVAESGVSLGSLYHHFGSMDGLSAALYTRSMSRLLDAIGSTLGGRRTAKAVVTRIVEGYLGFSADHPTEALFIHSSPSAGFLVSHAGAIAAAKRPRIERIAAALRPHVASGAIVPLPEAMLEMLIIGPAAEVSRRWLGGDPSIDLHAALRSLPERIWCSVRT